MQSRQGVTILRLESGQEDGHAVPQRQLAVAGLRGGVYGVPRVPAQLAQQEQRPHAQRLRRLRRHGQQLRRLVRQPEPSKVLIYGIPMSSDGSNPALARGTEGASGPPCLPSGPWRLCRHYVALQGTSRMSAARREARPSFPRRLPLSQPACLPPVARSHVYVHADVVPGNSVDKIRVAKTLETMLTLTSCLHPPYVPALRHNVAPSSFNTWIRAFIDSGAGP